MTYTIQFKTHDKSSLFAEQVSLTLNCKLKNSSTGIFNFYISKDRSGKRSYDFWLELNYKINWKEDQIAESFVGVGVEINPQAPQTVFMMNKTEESESLKWVKAIFDLVNIDIEDQERIESFIKTSTLTTKTVF